MRWTIIALFAWTTLGLSAQEVIPPTSTFHLKFGAGIGYQTYRDAAMSPLLYNGIQIGSYAGVEWRRRKGVYWIDGLFWLGETDSERSGAYTDNYNLAVNSGYLYHLNAESAAKWKFSVGGAITAWSSFREHSSLVNSDYFYDVFFSVGPSGAIKRDFRFLKRDWQLGLQLTVPVLTYGLRPNYSGLDEVPPDDNDGFEDEFNDAAFGSFNILTNVKSQIELLYPLKNGNRIGLLYYWDYYQSNIEPHSVKHSMQSVLLNLHFKL